MKSFKMFQKFSFVKRKKSLVTHVHSHIPVSKNLVLSVKAFGAETISICRSCVHFENAYVYFRLTNDIEIEENKNRNLNGNIFGKIPKGNSRTYKSLKGKRAHTHLANKAKKYVCIFFQLKPWQLIINVVTCACDYQAIYRHVNLKGIK